MNPCILCGGRGVVRAADVYRNVVTGNSEPYWELSRIIKCSCRYKEAA